MTEFNKSLETQKEYVRYHSALMRSFIPLLPEKDRIQGYAWLRKLSPLEGSPYQLKKQAEYLWFFIMNAVSSGGMGPPFLVPPGKGELEPLSSVVPKEVYANVLNNIERKRWWKPEPLKGGVEEPKKKECPQVPKKRLYISPESFVKYQPMPTHDGTFCYGCVFAPRNK